MGIVAVVGYARPVTVGMVGLFSGTAAISLIGSLCFFLALRHTTAATVSQYHYTQLITGTLVAFAIWRERPTAAMGLGAVLIVVSCWIAARIAHQQAVTPLQM